MPTRYYSSTAVSTTLSNSAASGATSIVVAATTGFPTSYPFTLIIDVDTASMEIVEVTAAAGTTLTVTRGVDGTSDVLHSAGATVKHGVSGRDFREFQDHEDATEDVHGVTGSIATQLAAIDDKIDSSLLATKGALLVGTATDPASLAVGSNGKGLVADSSQTSGVRWAGTLEPVSGTVTAADDFEITLGTFSASGGGAGNFGVLHLAATYTGGSLSVSNGNLPDTAVATLPAAWRPGQDQYVLWSSGTNFGTCKIAAATGAVTLATGVAQFITTSVLTIHTGYQL